ncbi:MAG: glycosyltransferase [Acidobacteria bacterium]|nr:glycosyltransferase [Acidobacteriota bacterium]
MLHSLPPVAFLMLAATSWREQLDQALFDDTFDGIHALNWFDYSLLIPYFTLLLILAFYGTHRYEVIWAYLKSRRTRKADAPNVAPKQWEQLPRVTIQLPLYNERLVVERLLENAVKIDYPRELLDIQVLDDSTDDTHPCTEALCAEYKAAGYPVEYIHRTDRYGYKAGALENGLKFCKGEFVAVFDADFVIPADFLMKTVHHFTDPTVGVVQGRWTYLNRYYNLLTEVQGMLLDGHFILEHNGRYRSGLFFNFNGTAGILRKSMIEDAGGWEHDTLTEDSDLSYRAQIKGWRFVYCPEVECPSELPFDMHGFQVQQARWAKGLTQVAIKLLRRILKTDLHWRVKLEAFSHLTPNITYPLMILVTAMMLPVMIVRFYVGWQQLLLVDLPLLMATFLSVVFFYIYAWYERDPKSWPRAVLMIPVLMAAGATLTVSNTKAVLEALMGVQTSFVRTPKYAITGTQTRENKRAEAVKKYRSKAGWLPWIEFGLGSYFLAMCFYAVDTYNFLAVPLLAVFVAGYYWASLSTLSREVRDRLARERARRLETARARS